MLHFIFKRDSVSTLASWSDGQKPVVSGCGVWWDCLLCVVGTGPDGVCSSTSFGCTPDSAVADGVAGNFLAGGADPPPRVGLCVVGMGPDGVSSSTSLGRTSGSAVADGVTGNFLAGGVDPRPWVGVRGAPQKPGVPCAISSGAVPAKVWEHIPCAALSLVKAWSAHLPPPAPPLSCAAPPARTAPRSG